MAKEFRFEKRSTGPLYEQDDSLVLWAHDDGTLRTTDEDGTETTVGSGNGGSQPLLTGISGTWAFDDTDIDDPAVGRIIHTLGPDEVLLQMLLTVDDPFSGADAAVADLYMSATTVADSTMIFVNNATPIFADSPGDDKIVEFAVAAAVANDAVAVSTAADGSDLPTGVPIVIAVASDNDPTQDVTVDGGSGTWHLVTTTIS